MLIYTTGEKKYSEAINLLQSENTFDLNHPHSVTLFSQTLLPSGFSAIRALCMQWWTPKDIYDQVRESNPAYGEQKWEEDWEIIAKIPSLRELRVLLCDQDGVREFERDLLTPLLCVRDVEIYDVIVSRPDTVSIETEIGVLPLSKLIRAES